MSALTGHPGRCRDRRFGTFGPVLLAILLATLLTGPAHAGAIRDWRARAVAARWQAARSAAPFRMARFRMARYRPSTRVRTLIPPGRSQFGTHPAVGPFGAYYRWALRTRATQVKVPPALRRMNLLTSNGTLANWAFVDYLGWRRHLAPARFDYYHPDMAQMFRIDRLVRQQTLPPVCPPPPPVVRPRTQTPLPPQVPEPSSALVALTLAGAGWYAQRRWGRRQSPAPWA